ncbi:MAG: hypothetical protein F8N38_21150 [Hungatella sp.]|nr:hypothetical protein [Hungatella sp.]
MLYEGNVGKSGAIITAYVLDNTLPSVSAESVRMLTHLNIAFALIRDNRGVYGNLTNLDDNPLLRRITPV